MGIGNDLIPAHSTGQFLHPLVGGGDEVEAARPVLSRSCSWVWWRRSMPSDRGGRPQVSFYLG